MVAAGTLHRIGCTEEESAARSSIRGGSALGQFSRTVRLGGNLHGHRIDCSLGLYGAVCLRHGGQILLFHVDN